MRLIDANAILENLPVVEKDKQISLIGAVADMVVLISNAPTIDAVPVVHYKGTNTTFINVKSIEDWQDRIILDEGEESHSGKVYYADSDDMVRVVRCKDCRFAFQNNGHDKEGCPIMYRHAWMDGNSFCSEGKPMCKKEETK